LFFFMSKSSSPGISTAPLATAAAFGRYMYS
jgi:hypothetical protein